MCSWILVAAACGRSLVRSPAIASATRLMEFYEIELWFFAVCSTIGKLMSFDTCVDRFWCWCDCCSSGVTVCPAKNSLIWFVWAVRSVTMWWLCLPVKKCIWEPEFIYLVRKFVSSLITCIKTHVVYCSFRIRFKIGAIIPSCSQRSGLRITLVASHPEDAFIDLLANSILGVKILSLVVKVAFWFLFTTVSTTLPISLPIFLLKHLSKVFTFTTFSLTAGPRSELPTVNSWLAVPSLTVVFSGLLLFIMPIATAWSKSSYWLRSLLSDCLFLWVEGMFVLTNQLYIKQWIP